MITHCQIPKNIDFSSLLFLIRKADEHNEEGTSSQGVSEPRILVQNNSEPETAGDGFRWRKYGQKVVKGNPYPRFVDVDNLLHYIYSTYLVLTRIEPYLIANMYTLDRLVVCLEAVSSFY